VSATANIVIIAAIITKIDPSTHDGRHQAASTWCRARS